jgi:hypothetical protein
MAAEGAEFLYSMARAGALASTTFLRAVCDAAIVQNVGDKL